MRWYIMQTYFTTACTVSVALLLLMLRYLPFSWTSKFGFRNDGRSEASDVTVQTAAAFDQSPASEVTADVLQVKHLRAGLATLLMRERSHLGKCTAHLIVWAGKKKRGRLVMVEDSHYDLGYLDGSELSALVVDSFTQAAIQKLDELVVKGTTKHRRKKTAVAAEVPEAITVAPALIEQQQTVEIEENVKPGPAIRLKKYPSVYRGEILFMGRMQRTDKEGKEFPCFGVKYMASEGIEDIVWGAHLDTAFKEARAGVGDHVEILKTGRKFVDEAKAPMNLYQVKKLTPEQLAALHAQ